MKKVLFMAFACLLMVMTACSSKTKEVQEKFDEMVSLSKEYKTAKDANDEAKMQELAKKGSEVMKAIAEIGKDLSENEQKEIVEANKSKMDYDLAYFQAAVEAYDNNTKIRSFEKQGNEFVYTFENEQHITHSIVM